MIVGLLAAVVAVQGLAPTPATAAAGDVEGAVVLAASTPYELNARALVDRAVARLSGSEAVPADLVAALAGVAQAAYADGARFHDGPTAADALQRAKRVASELHAGLQGHTLSGQERADHLAALGDLLLAVRQSTEAVVDDVAASLGDLPSAARELPDSPAPSRPAGS